MKTIIFKKKFPEKGYIVHKNPRWIKHGLENWRKIATYNLGILEHQRLIIYKQHINNKKPHFFLSTFSGGSDPACYSKPDMYSGFLQAECLCGYVIKFKHIASKELESLNEYLFSEELNAQELLECSKDRADCCDKTQWFKIYHSELKIRNIQKRWEQNRGKYYNKEFKKFVKNYKEDCRLHSNFR